MTHSETSPLLAMGDRAQAAMEAMELHVRAEMAEALIAGKAPPPSPLRAKWAEVTGRDLPPTIGEVVLEATREGGARVRKQLTRDLMTRPLLGRPLTARDRARLKRVIRPNSGTPTLERTELSAELMEIFAPDKQLNPKDPDGILKWQQGILADFIPTLALDDGRPDDAEPGEPTEEDDDGGTDDPDIPPSDSGVYTDLIFHVDRLECIETTSGEAGDDEINYSGIAVDGPIAGYISSDVRTEQTALRNAGSFGEGDSLDEGARSPMHLWPLSGVDLPHLFFMHLLMAEIDPQGGFSQYRQDLFYSLEAEVYSAWSDFIILTGFATSFGAAIGFGVGGPIGAAIGTAIGFLVGFTLSWFGWGNRDDVFRLGLAWLELQPGARNAAPFNGNDHSTPDNIIMRGDGGRYRLTYHWELRGGSTGPWDTDAPGDTDA